MIDHYGLLEKVVKNNDKPILILSPKNSPVLSSFYNKFPLATDLTNKLDCFATNLMVYSKIKNNQGALLICGVDENEIWGYSSTGGIDIREGISLLNRLEKLNFPTILLTYCLKHTNYLPRRVIGEENNSLGKLVKNMSHILVSSLERSFSTDLNYVLDCYLKGEIVEPPKDSIFFVPAVKQIK